MPAKIIPVIMCGGAGTRLWPVSRESMPKQFVPLIGQGSTFQQVMRRVRDPELFARPIVITNAEFRFVVAEQLRDCGISRGYRARTDAPRFRPRGRGRCCACARTRSPKLSCWCSRPITSSANSTSSAKHVEMPPTLRAAEGRIVTFGIHPTYAATNYGYIRRGKAAQRGGRARGGGLRRKARCPDGCQIRCRALSLEQRQFPLSRSHDVGGDRAVRAAYGAKP